MATPVDVNVDRALASSPSSNMCFSQALVIDWPLIEYEYPNRAHLSAVTVHVCMGDSEKSDHP
jgi:hypothetical protein